MKKCLQISLISGLLIILLTAVSAHGQKFAVYCITGIAEPVSPGDFKNYYDRNISYRLGLSYDYSENTSFRLGMASGTWEVNEETLISQYDFPVNIHEGETSVITGMLTAVRKFPMRHDSIIPYISGGLGIFHITSKTLYITQYDPYSGREKILKTGDMGDAVRFGYNTGIGVMLRTSEFIRFFGEFNYCAGIYSSGSISFTGILGGFMFYL